MRLSGLICSAFAAGVTAVLGADDFLDRLDGALTTTAFHDNLRVRLSGSVDLEGYYFQQPAPGLIYAENSTLLNPRLTLFLDAQCGARVYCFAQSRLDQGFDPSNDRRQLRLDEFAIRLTPWDDGVFNLQIGKFATVVGNWVPRHHSWDNPFITAPLPYENLTGIFDSAAVGAADVLLKWAGVRPSPYGVDAYYHQFRVPVIWGPSYASGAAISGALGRFDYAVEIKNAALSSRPESWDAARAQWQAPTLSGRVDYRPDESWNFGFSASTGAYLQPSALPTLAAGRKLGDYREVLFGQDVSYAWHHLQLWAEVYEARFAIPLVGPAETTAYYLEAKYKFTPQFFGAVRWNQQVFGSVPDGAGGRARWGRNAWRIDVAPSYRFTPHSQFKVQYSLLGEETGRRAYTNLLAAQLVVRF
jgi:hypothetical protein